MLIRNKKAFALGGLAGFVLSLIGFFVFLVLDASLEIWD